MVANTYAIEPSKAAALGMLAPKAGIAALSSILLDTCSGQHLANVCGAASQIYWKRLLANVQPVPSMFANVTAEELVKAESQQKVGAVIEDNPKHTIIWPVFLQHFGIALPIKLF